MSYFEIFTVVASSVTIFAFIAGIFSAYNGRRTQALLVREAEASRKLSEQMSRETQELIRRGEEATRQLADRMSRETQELIRREEEATRELIRETQEGTQRILQGITEILGRIEARVH
jgi:gas vesicle protein